MTGVLHLPLRVDGAPNDGTQPVEVEHLGGADYRVLYSPGLVEGIAAGDSIRVEGIDFEVIARGGNIAIKVTGGQEGLSDAVVEFLRESLGALGGRLDGRVRSAAVWSVPDAAGFGAIEQILGRVCNLEPDVVWWYGNVYDDNDQPLLWWRNE